jgi:hypothetical protein
MLLLKILGIWILAGTAFAGWRRQSYGKEIQSPHVFPLTNVQGKPRS